VLIVSVGLLWLASLVAPSIFLIIMPNGDGDPYTTQWLWAMFVYFGPLSHLPEFLTGIVLGRLFLSQTARRAPGRHVLALAAAGAGLGALGYVLAAYAGGALPRMLTHTGVFLPIYAVLVYSLALGGGPIGRLLGTPPLLLLGEASYGLYLLHYPVFWWTERVVGRFPVVAGIYWSRWFAVLEVCLAVAISVAVYLVVERPARRCLRSFLSSRSRAAPAPESSAAQAPVGVAVVS
jgi:peptidoglycan/LPS O-acetylase OafA/YrhL